jgi:autotransporter-associated beta strand protein
MNPRHPPQGCDRLPDSRFVFHTADAASPGRWNVLPMRSSQLLLTALAIIVGTARLDAGSATWDLNPTSNDWNTAANWTPETVPNGASDVATFDVSNVTDVTISSDPGDYVFLDSIVFNSGASPYNITFYGEILGGGVINNSGIVENIDSISGLGFDGHASAGEDVVYTNTGGPLRSQLDFHYYSNADSATFINSGYILFWDTSSAANSSIINESGGNTSFRDSSTAADSTITTQSGAVLEIYGSATAGDATLIADGGTIAFEASSDGGLARVELTNGGMLTVAGHSAASAMLIGSLEGDNLSGVGLGHRQLTIGGNGLSTTFGGVLTGPGSLIKAGNETLILTGANTYLGLTTVTGGTLVAAAATGSPTGAGPVQVNAGTFGGTGSVTGGVTVGTGTGTHAFLAPGVNGPGTLSLASFLIFNSDGSYKCELAATPHPRVDQVSANGVTIERGARFMLRTKGNQTLPMGTVFTVISNTATTRIAGFFANLPDGSTFTVGNNTFQVSYEGGDGNDLTLTVVP